MSHRTCSVDGCGKTHAARGWCEKHWARWKRLGTVDLPTDLDRFLTKVRKTDTCWLWTAGCYSNEYGKFGVDGGQALAHRWAYRHFVGPIPEGMHVDHTCWTRACVNPAHLRLATPAQNAQNVASATSRSLTGIRGVSWSDKYRRYVVQVTANRYNHFGGYFDTLEDAEAAAIALRNRVMTHNTADRPSLTDAG